MAFYNPFKPNKKNQDNKFEFGNMSTAKEKDYFSTSFLFARPEAPVTEKEALQIPAIKAAVELISSSIAQLPVHLYVEDDKNHTVTHVHNDQRVLRLNHSANQYETGQTLKRLLVQDYLLRGKSYIYKKDDGSLYVLPASLVVEETKTEDYITVIGKDYYFNGMQTLLLNEEQVFEFNSGTYGILHDNSDLIQTAIAQMDFNRSLLSNGAVPTGILKAAGRLTQPVIDKLRASFKTLYSSEKNAGRTVILEEGMDYSPVSLNMDELQFNETQKTIVSEICRIFNLPESMINASLTKYSSNEQNSIQFLQMTLAPIITNIESYLDQNFLTDQEKASGYYFRFKTDELLRVTQEDKIKNTLAALNGGLIKINEARHEIDLTPVEKDCFHAKMGQALIYDDGSILNLNTMSSNQSKQEGENPQNEDGDKG